MRQRLEHAFRLSVVWGVIHGRNVDICKEHHSKIHVYKNEGQLCCGFMRQCVVADQPLTPDLWLRPTRPAVALVVNTLPCFHDHRGTEQAAAVVQTHHVVSTLSQIVMDVPDVSRPVPRRQALSHLLSHAVQHSCGSPRFFLIAEENVLIRC